MQKVWIYTKTGDDFETIQVMFDVWFGDRFPSYEHYMDGDWDRTNYDIMIEDILDNEGVLIIQSLDSLGTSDAEILEELLRFRSIHLQLIVFDYPSTNLVYEPQLSEVALNVMIDMLSIPRRER